MSSREGGLIVATKRHSVEQIIAKLMEVKKLTGRGRPSSTTSTTRNGHIARSG
jgi:hypothetical protein